MNYKVLFLFFVSIFSQSVFANWEKINDLDYTWGPFKIYNITLFTENGEYEPDIRPLMLSLKYDKPVDGRDFAISLARAWASLEIQLPERNKIIERMRKSLPDLKPGDQLSYIALADRGYFVVNDRVIPEEFSQKVNDAIVAVWLDPRTEISPKITVKKIDDQQSVYVAQYAVQDVTHNVKEKTATAQMKAFALAQAQFSKKILTNPAIGVPVKAIVEKEKAVEKTEDIANQPEKKAEIKTENLPAEKAEIATKTEQDTEQKQENKTEQEAQPNYDPENPELEIRPIEDPMPENRRAS